MLDGVEVPAENVLGERGKGFGIALGGLDGGRIGIAAQATGILAACLEDSRRYALERKQFGKPIAEFQPIRWKLADMAVDLDVCRLLTRRAAWLRDAGRPHTKEASMAKLFASEEVLKVCQHAVELHGGNGTMLDFGIEKLYRDATMFLQMDGTVDITKFKIVKAMFPDTAGMYAGPEK